MAGRTESTSSPRRINAVEKQRQALELRKAGATYQTIADRLGYAGFAGAYKAVKSAMQKTIQEPADELRQMETERLDALLLAVWPNARAGNLGAVDRVLRIMKRRAELLGLDAPQQVDLTTGGESLTFTIQIDRAGGDDSDTE